MRHVLILDTETTGLDPATCAVIEVGCIAYDVAHAVPLESFASLLCADSNAAEAINHIPAGVLRDAPEPADVWARVERMMFDADAILAHNAAFDRGFVPPEIRNMHPWICTKDDLDWPRATKPGLSLVVLALDHGLGVATAHRALADCDLISRLLSRAHELGVDLAPFLARGLRPKATYQALVSYADRDLAKAAGFRWEGETKRWLRRLVVEDAAHIGFPVREVAP